MQSVVVRRHRLIVALAASLTVGIALLTAPHARAATPPKAATAGVDAKAEPGDPPPAPDDEDKDTDGIQVSVPYYTEPEFTLQAGKERWNIRNRPVGTVVAGYGHEDDAVNDGMTATARYNPLGPGQATGQPLDLTTVVPADQRHFSWMITRYDDGTVEVDGPLERGMPIKTTLGPSATAPQGYVGGTVLSDTVDGVPAILLVRANGTLVKVVRTGPRDITFTEMGDVGGPAVAAVSRSVSTFATAPRVQAISDHAPDTSTIMVVWRADGQFVPIRVGTPGGNGITKLPTMSSTLNAGLVATPVFSPTTFDFDFSCVQLHHFAFAAAFTGPAAVYLGCGTGTSGGGAQDTFSLGRISVAVPVKSGNIPVVRALTSGDYATQIDANNFIAIKEDIAETGCTYSHQPTDGTGIVPVGSFDIRTVVGVTHLACVEPAGDQLAISEYLQPRSDMAQLTSGEQPSDRSSQTAQLSRPIEQTTYDHMYVPQGTQEDPDSGEVPLEHLTYANITQPTIQLQFPCEHLLARLGNDEHPNLRGKIIMDDCDTSTNIPLPDGYQSAPPPPNWATYTVAAYATTQVDGQDEPRLVVTNTPSSLPLDRTLLNSDPSHPFGNYSGPANFSWTVEPAAYLASDLTDIRSGDDVDVSTLNVYHAPAQNAPRLLLGQVARAARTTVQMTLTVDANATPPSPRVEVSPSTPIAILQPPPIVRGLGQDEGVAPTFSWTVETGQGTETGRSTKLGAHVEASAVATAGAGIAGNEVELGGGAAVGFEFLNEVEESIERTVTSSKSGTYGGSFDVPTLISRTVSEYVWDGTITSDPTGLATGEPIAYAVPYDDDSEDWDEFSLEDLQNDPEEAPLYGPNGLYADSLARLEGSIVVGDPGSYLQGTLDEPANILAGQGGPCKGEYPTNGQNPALFTGDLPKVVDPTNPFLGTSPPDPTGPDILISKRLTAGVDDGHGFEDTARLGIDEETARSRLATDSYDFSVSGILKAEAGLELGVAEKLEVEVRAGVDAGWSNVSGVSDTLGTSTEMEGMVKGFSWSPDDVGSWIDGETYKWRMFMCKAQFGPLALGQEVWVLGYVTSGYAAGATHGIDEVEPPTDTLPAPQALVRANPAQAPGATTTTACVGGPNEFSWEQESGTLKSLHLEFQDRDPLGTEVSRKVDHWKTPNIFIEKYKRNADDDRDGVIDRQTCAAVDPGSFVDDHFYNWSVVADAFVPEVADACRTIDGEPDQCGSKLKIIHAEVWPPDQTLSLKKPVIGSDGTTTIKVNRDGMNSLVYRATITDANGDEVESGPMHGTTYKTGALDPGTYKASVVGSNDQVLPEGGKAETPAATVQFTVLPALTVKNAAGVKEGPRSAKFVIELNEPSDKAITVHYATVDGTAKAGQDYVARTGDLTFAAGQTQKTVLVRIKQDKLKERTENFKLRVTAPATVVMIVDALGLGAILDDD